MEPAPVIEDEETRAGSVDDETSEPPQLTPSTNPPEVENSSSSSSEDKPILSRLEPGAKRKAEVLSKESGKIGVTITTSSPSSPTPPPLKVRRYWRYCKGLSEMKRNFVSNSKKRKILEKIKTNKKKRIVCISNMCIHWWYHIFLNNSVHYTKSSLFLYFF